MRARRREINIFNMSLLDILCGALGAFCFMMLVALPYYKPPGSEKDLREAQAETQRLLRDLEKMKDRMSDPKSIAEMEELIRRLEARVKALQGQVNILSAEKEQLQGEVNQLTAEKQQLQEANQQLTAKNKDLAAANQKLAILLAQKKPFVVLARAYEMSQNLDLIAMDKTASEKKVQGPHPAFKAWLSGEFGLFNRVRVAFLSGTGTSLGVVTDAPIGTQYKLYVRLANDPTARQSTAIDSALFADEREGPPMRLSKVTLSPERFWTVLGTITIEGDNRPRFKEATAEERDAEWEALTNSTPPPPAPTPTPRPTPSAAEREAAAAARARRQDVGKKFNRLMGLRQLDSGANDAEILALTEELMKELPPGDSLRRHVESIREQTLAQKARREGEQPPQQPPRSPAPMPVPTP